MGLNSNDSDMTTLKVVYNGLARRVKVPYDMEWQDFETKVCRLFNIPPPLVTSYKDNMGISVIVDNSDDFFFFLDEEYTGRLDIVANAEPSEASEWTVVRTDSKKVVKEEFNASEVSIGDNKSQESKPERFLHSLNPSQNSSIRGASPMDKEIENPQRDAPAQGETLVENDVVARDDFEQSTEIPQGLQTSGKASPLSESLSDMPDTTSTIPEQSVIPQEDRVSKASELDSFSSEVIKDEAVEPVLSQDFELEVQPADKVDIPQNQQALQSSENILSFPEVICELDDVASSEDDEYSIEKLKYEIPLLEVIPGQESIEVTRELESLDSSSMVQSSLSKEVDQAPQPLGSVSDTMSLSIVELDPYTGTNQVSALYSPVAPVSEGLPSHGKDFEDDIEREGEPSGASSASGAPKDFDPATEELGRLRKGQELRDLCYKFSDVFRHHSALLPTVELFVDQISHGVPIDFEVLKSGLQRLALSSSETPRLIEEVTSNLVESVGSVVNQIGSSLSSFIEHDVSKFLSTLSIHESQTPVDPIIKSEVNEATRETVVEPTESRRHHRRCSRKRKSHVCSTHRSESITPSELPAPRCELPIPQSEPPSTSAPSGSSQTFHFPIFNPGNHFENPFNSSVPVERSRRPYSSNSLFQAPASSYRPMSFAEAIKPTSEPSYARPMPVPEVNPADVALISGLVALREMGFHDDSANLEALQANSGNVANAVDALISKLR